MILPGTYANGFAPRDGRPLYPSLWKGCVGAWNPGLGVSGLTLKDQSGFGFHGTLTNGPTWAASQGKYALSFDGVDDHCPVYNGSLRQLTGGGSDTNAAVSAWVYLIGATSTQQVIIADWNTSGSNETLRLSVSGYLITANRWGGNVYEIGGVSPNISSTNAVQNVWTHLCLQRVSSTSAELYVNGKLDNTSTSSYNVSPSSSYLTIGRAGNYDGGYFNGYISEVMLHKRALSPQEIRLLATRRGIAYEMAPRRKTYFIPPSVLRYNLFSGSIGNTDVIGAS